MPMLGSHHGAGVGLAAGRWTRVPCRRDETRPRLGRDSGESVHARARPSCLPSGVSAPSTTCRPRSGRLCSGFDPVTCTQPRRTRDAKGFHVEYGYSCMGYEVARRLGVKMAAPDRDVFVMVGDGSWLMLSSEIVMPSRSGSRLSSSSSRITATSRSARSPNRSARNASGPGTGSGSEKSGRLDGDVLPVDLARARRAWAPASARRGRGRAEGRSRRAKRYHVPRPHRDPRSRRIHSSGRQTATAGGTCRWPRLPASPRPVRR